jgi:hypothetical protein
MADVRMFELPQGRLRSDKSNTSALNRHYVAPQTIFFPALFLQRAL